MVPVICLLAALLMSCGPSTKQTETEAPETGATGAAGGRRAAAKKSAPQSVSVTVPAGTELAVRLGQEISSGTASDGATFEGTLASPLVVNGTEVAAVGSAVTGTVTHAVSSGRLNRPAELSLVLTSFTAKGGEKIDVSTAAWGMKGESHKKRNVEMIGGGAAAGAVIGALTGGKKGAAIGGALGAGGGTGVAAATGKKEIVLAPETKLTFKLSESVPVSIRK
jgi:hypothetical protein